MITMLWQNIKMCVQCIKSGYLLHVTTSLPSSFSGAGFRLTHMEDIAKLFVMIKRKYIVAERDYNRGHPNTNS